MEWLRRAATVMACAEFGHPPRFLLYNRQCHCVGGVRARPCGAGKLRIIACLGKEEDTDVSARAIGTLMGILQFRIWPMDVSPLHALCPEVLGV